MKNLKAAHNYLERMHSYLTKFDPKEMDQIVEILISAETNGSQVLIAGNGGSASTASHMATDLMSLNSKINFKLKVISLPENNSLITAIGNDHDFNQIFCQQVKILGGEKDVLIVISASGNSPNLIYALEAAKRLKIETVGILGFDGGKIKDLVSICLVVETKLGDYGPVEDIHLMINHMIKEEIISRINLAGYGSKEIEN